MNQKEFEQFISNFRSDELDLPDINGSSALFVFLGAPSTRKNTSSLEIINHSNTNDLSIEADIEVEQYPEYEADARSLSNKVLKDSDFSTSYVEKHVHGSRVHLHPNMRVKPYQLKDTIKELSAKSFAIANAFRKAEESGDLVTKKW